jgi:hypothetical protein
MPRKKARKIFVKFFYKKNILFAGTYCNYFYFKGRCLDNNIFLRKGNHPAPYGAPRHGGELTSTSTTTSTSKHCTPQNSQPWRGAAAAAGWFVFDVYL